MRNEAAYLAENSAHQGGMAFSCQSISRSVPSLICVPITHRQLSISVACRCGLRGVVAHLGRLGPILVVFAVLPGAHEDATSDASQAAVPPTAPAGPPCYWGRVGYGTWTVYTYFLKLFIGSVKMPKEPRVPCCIVQSHRHSICCRRYSPRQSSFCKYSPSENMEYDTSGPWESPSRCEYS